MEKLSCCLFLFFAQAGFYAGVFIDLASPVDGHILLKIAQVIYILNTIHPYMVVCSDIDRDVKIFHARQRGIVWYAFVVSDITKKVSDANAFKTGLRALIEHDPNPVEERNGSIFLRGPYDPETLGKIRGYLSQQLPSGAYQELTGDYFNFRSRYHFWDLIDKQPHAATGK